MNCNTERSRLTHEAPESTWSTFSSCPDIIVFEVESEPRLQAEQQSVSKRPDFFVSMSFCVSYVIKQMRLPQNDSLSSQNRKEVLNEENVCRD